MIPRQSPSAELLQLAALQAGVLSTEQVAAFGLARTPVVRLLAGENGWQRMATGLYLLASGEPSWEAKAWGGVLLGGDRARLGGAAAGYLWGLRSEPAEIVVLVPHDRPRRARQSWRFVREHAGLRGPSQGSPPRIGIDDVVFDLCAELDEQEVIAMVTTAVQSRRTTARRLQRRLEQRTRLRHRRLLRNLLDDVGQGAESPLELAYLRDVERAHDLPRGVRQHRLTGGRQVRDILYEQYAVVVELDGRTGHEGLGRFRDMRRDNDALLRGEVTLRYGWSDVCGRSCAVAWQVASILAGQGWPGLPCRCPRCAFVPIEELGVA